MTKRPCQLCDDSGWVCESHPDKPWAGASDRADACDCGGAGEPCPVCNVPDPGERPDLARSGIVIDLDVDGTSH